MSRPNLVPSPGPILDRVYDRLPAHYRAADAAQTFPDYPLYRWLAGICAELGQLEALLTRIDYVPPADGGDAGDTSDLTDPLTADIRWLPWLAQLVGVVLPPSLTDAEMRDAVRFASSGWRAGTKPAVADAAKTELTGTRYARVYDHSTGAVNGVGAGGPWDVLIVTRSTETPSVAAVVAAVSRRNAKPAGVVLHHRAYEASWDTVEATFPSWDAIEAAGSWDRIQEAGL